jgi:hypothetical protein
MLRKSVATNAGNISRSNTVRRMMYATNRANKTGIRSIVLSGFFGIFTPFPLYNNQA